MGKVTNIEEKMEHTVSELICIRCCNRWISVRPSTLLLKDMECPYCKAFRAVIKTGQELEGIEDGKDILWQMWRIHTT